MPRGPEDWDAWAAGGAAAACPKDLDRTVANLLRRLPGRRGMTAADLGCGRGRMLPFLAGHFQRVVALDFAPASLAWARHGCRGLGVEFRRRDLRDLTPFRARFDVALALESLLGPRTGDVDRMLVQVFLSLTEGGLLVASFPAVELRQRDCPLALVHSEPAAWGEGFHEVGLQYRLRRAGFRGLRLQRFKGEEDEPDAILCVAARRANN